ncbi:hypothetical protein RND71_019411 [Anisodus tanguticus]|uniref:Uncharacterized protein n=1 Tax=Anisodus tanguticus TaxID=243964 RepID=A0AAE1VGF3_9SOLA|nr:hypothetical protein RND71_019411 [Anisodus tanguticus]
MKCIGSNEESRYETHRDFVRKSVFERFENLPLKVRKSVFERFENPSLRVRKSVFEGSMLRIFESFLGPKFKKSEIFLKRIRRFKTRLGSLPEKKLLDKMKILRRKKTFTRIGFRMRLKWWKCSTIFASTITRQIQKKKSPTSNIKSVSSIQFLKDQNSIILRQLAELELQFAPDILASAYFTSFLMTGGWNHDNLLSALEAYEKAEKIDTTNSHPNLRYDCAVVSF